MVKNQGFGREEASEERMITTLERCQRIAFHRKGERSGGLERLIAAGQKDFIEGKGWAGGARLRKPRKGLWKHERLRDRDDFKEPKWKTRDWDGKLVNLSGGGRKKKAIGRGNPLGQKSCPRGFAGGEQSHRPGIWKNE